MRFSFLFFQIGVVFLLVLLVPFFAIPLEFGVIDFLFKIAAEFLVFLQEGLDDK